MNKRVLIILCLTLLVFFLPTVVLGKNEDAPGQKKKESQTQTGSASQTASSNPGQGKGQSKEQPKAGGAENNNQGEKVKPTQKSKKDKDAGTSEVKKGGPKLGKEKLRGIFSRLATEGGEISTMGGKGKKLEKIKAAIATVSAQLKRRAVMGVITNIADNILTLAHQIQRERIYNVTVGDNTIITIKEVENPTLGDLSVGMRIAAVGDLLPDGGILAKRIHVIPGKAIGVFEKQPIATSSPTLAPTLSPSATISATPSLTPTTLPTPSLTLTPTP